MQISVSIIAGFFAAALSAVQGMSIAERQEPRRSGEIITPEPHSSIRAGEGISFSYHNPTYCNPDVVAITIWLTHNAPTYANVNSTGGIEDYLHYWGSYRNRRDDRTSHYFKNWNRAGFTGFPTLALPIQLTTPDLPYDIAQIVYISAVADIRSCVSTSMCPSPFLRSLIGYMMFSLMPRMITI